MRFKTLKESLEKKTQGGLYLSAVNLAVTNGIRARHQVVCQRERWCPKWGWIVKSHLGWRGEQNIIYKSVETSP